MVETLAISSKPTGRKSGANRSATKQKKQAKGARVSLRSDQKRTCKIPSHQHPRNKRKAARALLKKRTTVPIRQSSAAMWTAGMMNGSRRFQKMASGIRSCRKLIRSSRTIQAIAGPTFAGTIRTPTGDSTAPRLSSQPFIRPLRSK